MAELVVIRQAGAAGPMQENEFHWLMLSKMICYRKQCGFSNRNSIVIKRFPGMIEAKRKAPVKPALFFDH
jgi:hypothetical protein